MVLSTTECVICYQKHQPNMDNVIHKKQQQQRNMHKLIN